DEKDHENLRVFFRELSRHLIRVLVPGAHVMIATNPLLSHLVYLPMMEAGFEKRGEIVRLVQTLRGGDRPKNAHEEVAPVSALRSPWATAPSSTHSWVRAPPPPPHLHKDFAASASSLIAPTSAWPRRQSHNWRPLPWTRKSGMAPSGSIDAAVPLPPGLEPSA